MNNISENSKNAIWVQIGQKIQKYRLQMNLTQEQVAEYAGISQKHLSRIEQGYHCPRFDMIIRIAEVLNITIDALAENTPDDTDMFLKRIRPDIEKLSEHQKKYIEQCIKLLAEMNF